MARCTLWWCRSPKQSMCQFLSNINVTYLDRSEKSGDEAVWSRLNSEQRQLLGDLLRKAGDEPQPLEVGEDIVSSSHLPCHSDVHQSHFTTQRIQVADRCSRIYLYVAVKFGKIIVDCLYVWVLVYFCFNSTEMFVDVYMYGVYVRQAMLFVGPGVLPGRRSLSSLYQRSSYVGQGHAFFPTGIRC